MTHEEKVKYMSIASGVVGYIFDSKSLDMLVSIYDYVLKNGGDGDIKSIIKIQCEVEERHKKESNNQ